MRESVIGSARWEFSHGRRKIHGSEGVDEESVEALEIGRERRRERKWFAAAEIRLVA